MLREYIQEWAKLMVSIFYGITWIVIILLSMALIVALPILVVALFYFLVHLMFGIVFEWYIPIAIGLCFLMVIGMVLVD